MPYVYILANKPFGTLYIGVTNDIARRVYEHKEKRIDGFSSKYNLTMLVYYEVFEHMHEAIAREKAMKFWKRDWKIQAIQKINPEWKDLHEDLNK